MAQAVILEFDGVSKDHYDAVNAKLGLDPGAGTGDWPEGMISHTGGTTSGGGIVVFEVWESQDAQAKFMETRLGAALGEVGLPQPKRVEWFDVLGNTVL